MKSILSGLLLAFCMLASAQNPQVSNLQFTRQTADTTQVSLQFSLAHPASLPCEVWLRYSVDGGRIYKNVPGATGDLGFPVSAGSRNIQFNTAQLQGVGALPVKFRIVASDRQAVDIAQLVAQVDTNRLKQDVRNIAIPRNYNAQTQTLARVRDSVQTRLAQFNLPSYRHEFMFNNFLCGNVVARQSGHLRDTSVWVIDAHFDGVSNSPGADDNASGVAGMLEAARILSQYEFEESLQFIGFDVEEEGLVGSNRYTLNAIPAGDRIKGVFNFEMIGYYDTAANSQQLPAGFNQLFPALYNQIQSEGFRGDFLTNVGNAASLPLTAIFDSAAARYVPTLKVRSLNVPGNGSIAPDLRRSDHASFWDRGYQALMLTDGANFRNSRYHTPADSAATLNYRFMQQVVQATVAAAATAAKPMRAGKADATYGFALAVDGHAQHADCEMRLLPNPNNGRFVLQIAGCAVPYGPASLRVFSLDGRQHHESWLEPATEHRLELNLPLPAGTYLVVTDNGHESYTQKLLVR